MPRFSHRLPADVTARLDLARGDAVLAGAHLDGGGWAVATLRAFHLLAEDAASMGAAGPALRRAGRCSAAERIGPIVRKPLPKRKRG